MSKNIDQVYIANPITSNASTDLMYFGQSPYAAGDDAAMTYANFAAQFGTPFTPAALTKADDTNVTLTLGGTPATALLEATSLTLGWTGQLSLARGGTNANLTASNGGIFYSTATAGAILAGTATAGQLLTSGASTTPAWTTTTYPLTNAISTLLYASSANVMAALATLNNGVLTTGATGIPAWLANGTAGYVLTANSGAPPSWQVNSAVFLWIAAPSTPVTATVNTGYYITNASQVTITLPVTAAAGSVVAIAGNGAGGWILQPGAGQTIKIQAGSASTSITSAEQYDCIEVICTVANTTWVARSVVTTGFSVV